MEMTKIELATIEQTTVLADKIQAELNELSELQLTLVGGGIADPIAF